MFYILQQQVIGRCIANDGLFRDRLEIAVPDFNGDASGEFVIVAQFESDLFRHPDQFPVNECHIDSICFESIFGADAFLFMVGNDR